MLLYNYALCEYVLGVYVKKKKKKGLGLGHTQTPDNGFGLILCFDVET